MLQVADRPLVAVISGVGPYAGLDFQRKILDNTLASKDQEHASFVALSCPALIPDRTAWLLDPEASDNPAEGLFICARMAWSIGAKAIAVACNTAHAGKIFGPLRSRVEQDLPGLTLVNMIQACAEHIALHTPYRRIGLLATKGTHAARVYHEYVNAELGLTLIEPESRGIEKIHQAIYHPQYGIKATGTPVTNRAESIIAAEVWRLEDKGVDAVILGCTELPLALGHKEFDLPLIDPGVLAARELVRASVPDRLRPFARSDTGVA